LASGAGFGIFCGEARCCVSGNREGGVDKAGDRMSVTRRTQVKVQRHILIGISRSYSNYYPSQIPENPLADEFNFLDLSGC
jgi:hypothetical protein